MQPITEEVIPAETLKRIQSLSFFYDEFYKNVEEHNFSTRSYRYRIVAERIEEFEIHKYRNVVFAGFTRLQNLNKSCSTRCFALIIPTSSSRMVRG